MKLFNPLHPEHHALHVLSCPFYRWKKTRYRKVLFPVPASQFQRGQSWDLNQALKYPMLLTMADTALCAQAGEATQQTLATSLHFLTRNSNI